MRSRRRLKQLLIGTLRGTVVALSLLGYLAASIGFPAPALTAERTAQSEEPSSACSGGACGCGAEPGHCCCCSRKTKPIPPPPPPPPPAPTPATPPSHCNKGGDSETACPLCEARALLFVNPDEASELLGDEPCPFCAKAEDPAPCCDEPKPTEPAKPEINNPPPRDESSGDVSIRWVQGVQARHCHGLDTLWYGLTAALPLPPPLRWEADQRAVEWLAPITPLADSVSRVPPAPPPRG